MRGSSVPHFFYPSGLGVMTENELLKVGARIALKFMDSGPYFLRYEVVSLKGNEVALLALDFPGYSRVISLDLFKTGIRFYLKYIAEMDAVSGSLFHNMISIDDYAAV